jgi:hypothetical protein
MISPPTDSYLCFTGYPISKNPNEFKIKSEGYVQIQDYRFTNAELSDEKYNKLGIDKDTYIARIPKVMLTRNSISRKIS